MYQVDVARSLFASWDDAKSDNSKTIHGLNENDQLSVHEGKLMADDYRWISWTQFSGSKSQKKNTQIDKHILIQCPIFQKYFPKQTQTS